MSVLFSILLLGFACYGVVHCCISLRRRITKYIKGKNKVVDVTTKNEEVKKNASTNEQSIGL